MPIRATEPNGSLPRSLQSRSVSTGSLNRRAPTETGSPLAPTYPAFLYDHQRIDPHPTARLLLAFTTRACYGTTRNVVIASAHQTHRPIKLYGVQRNVAAAPPGKLYEKLELLGA